jgi:5-methylcytosine-specific restriction endonuclease McrA
METLVLDDAYRPHAIVSWRRATTLLFLGKVEVVEEYADRELRAVSLRIAMPAVVRLLARVRRRKSALRFSRLNILARDGWRCQYCGARKAVADLNYDHVVPRARGGRTVWENIVTCCYACNARKADRTPDEAGMRLLRPPARPAWLPITLLRLEPHVRVPAPWASYVYWTGKLDTP